MKSSSFKARHTPQLAVDSIAQLEHERAKALADANSLHVALAEIHKEVSAKKSQNRTNARKLHNL